MTRNERLLNEAKTSISEANRIISKIESMDAECIHRLGTVANQVSQASAEINQLIGSLREKFFGD